MITLSLGDSSAIHVFAIANFLACSRLYFAIAGPQAVRQMTIPVRGHREEPLTAVAKSLSRYVSSPVLTAAYGDSSEIDR